MLFSFPKNQETKLDKPLSRIGGELLIDSGNEDPSYVFRAQERYLPYTCMLNNRSLFFVQGPEHLDSYHNRLSFYQNHHSVLAEYTGFSIEEIDPVFVELSDDNLIKVLDKKSFPFNAISINQLSPTIVRLLHQIDNQTATNYDLQQYESVANLALRLSSKAEYIRLIVENQNRDLPLHTDTLILEEDQFFNYTFEQLQNYFLEETGIVCEEFFVKSAVDAGGELGGVFNRNNFDQKISRLAHDSEGKHRQHKIEFLIQRRLISDSCVGFSYFIQDRENISRIVASGQIHEDEERKEFLGAVLSEELERSIFQKVNENQIINMCQLFADLGYRGPINFDAIENEDGEYEFIGDCNPRLSAVYPNLAVRDFLRKQGMAVRSIANLGYRGRVILNDFRKTLDQLGQQDLLFSQSHPFGIWVVPSFTRENRFDFWFINMPNEAIEQFVSSDYFEEILHSDNCDFKGIYL